MPAKLTKEIFISRAISVHGHRYLYDEVEYKSNNITVLVGCRIHGYFMPTPSAHMGGTGCPKCGQIKAKRAVVKDTLSKRKWPEKQPEDYKLVPLSCGTLFKVSNEDFDRVRRICWRFIGKGYVWNETYGYVHRFILNYTGSKDIDHKNNDKLDNTRDNLRVATKSQNLANKGSHKGSSSKYTGVSLYKKDNKWHACITINRKTIHLGTFVDEKEAGMAYDKKALELHGEFARLNFPELREKYLKLK